MTCGFNLHKLNYTSYIEKRFAKGMYITFKSEENWTIEEDCSKSNSKEKEVQSFVLCVGQPIDCQQEEEKRSYSRFVKVVIGIIIVALLLVLFGKVGVFMLVFVLRVNVFHAIIYVAVLYMNYPQCGDCALPASFVKECSDVSYVAGERVKLTVHKETVVEERKEVELRSRYAQFINWAACGESSLRHEFNFSRGGWGWYFWEVVVGVHRPPHIIFTLFRSNIYTVNVREFLPRDKTDKGMPRGMCALYITMSKKI